MSYSRTFAEFCPETGRRMSILVSVEKLLLGGFLSHGLKVMGYTCNYHSEHSCGTCGSMGLECPVYRKARAAIEG